LFPPDFSNFWYYVTKILETLQMAILGVVLGTVIAFPLSFLAARNMISNRIVCTIFRGLFDVFRGIHEIVWALIFVSMVGLGPFPGVLALAIHVAGSLGRYFSETIETVKPETLNAILSTGASKIQIIIRGVFPEIKPLALNYCLYYLEHNFRAATVLGIVGAGGIGMELLMSIHLYNYPELSAILIMMTITIILLDNFSAYARGRILRIESIK